MIEENRNNISKNTIQVLGGQFNICEDNGTINTVQNNIEDKSKSSLNNFISVMLFILSILSIEIYIQHREPILSGFIIMFILLLFFTCAICHKGKKNKIFNDENLKQPVIFDIIFIILILVILILMKNSTFYNREVDFNLLEQKIMAKGIIQVCVNFGGMYVVFQIIGLFLIGMFFIYILKFDLEVIKLFNGKKKRKIYREIKNKQKHIKGGFVFISLIFIMTNILFWKLFF